LVRMAQHKDLKASVKGATVVFKGGKKGATVSF
jgi:hypothetical protein